MTEQQQKAKEEAEKLAAEQAAKSEAERIEAEKLKAEQEEKERIAAEAKAKEEAEAAKAKAEAEKAKNKKPKTGLTEQEFFALPDLSAKKAQIFVKILGKKKFNEQGKVEVLTEDKEIKVAPAYWLSVHRTYKDADDVIGEPTDPQELVAYELDGEKFFFKK